MSIRRLLNRKQQSAESYTVSDNRHPGAPQTQSHTRSASYHPSSDNPLLGAGRYVDPNSLRRSSTQTSTPRPSSQGVAASPPSYEHAMVNQDSNVPRPIQGPASSPTRRGLPVPPVFEAETSAENPLKALARYDLVFLIDDSASMLPLWRQAQEALAGVVEQSIKFDEDGIDVYFLNHPKVAQGCTSTRTVANLFAEVRPRGSTPTAFRIDDILRPYIERVEDCKKAKERLPKPMVCVCVTDGRADDPETLTDIIVEMAGRLDGIRAPPFQLGIQFLQIGSDPDATQFLRTLDDDLKSTHNIRDCVDTVEYLGTLTPEFILQCCLGSINRRIDSQSH